MPNGKSKYGAGRCHGKTLHVVCWRIHGGARLEPRWGGGGGGGADVPFVRRMAVA